MYRVVKYPNDKSYGKYFNKVLSFLNDHNENGDFIHFHWSRWEWMFARDSFRVEDLDQIVLFEQNKRIKGALIFEDDPDQGFFAVYEDELYLKKFMVDYFNKHYHHSDIIISRDKEMNDLIKEIGYEKTDWIDPVTKSSLHDLQIPKTKGYEIVSLEEDYRLDQIHYVLHRGFNHGDLVDYSNKTLEMRRHETSSPNFKKKYTYVAIKNNQYVSYAGLWYIKGTKTALVEPVATVPDHRKKFLARACIYKAIQASIDDGAQDIYVDSNRDFYMNMGFESYDFAVRYKRK